MVVCVVGSPRFHTLSREAVAFLSEIINRVTITGRYLRCSSDLTASDTKIYSDVHDVPTVARRKIRRTNEGSAYWDYLRGREQLESRL